MFPNLTYNNNQQLDISGSVNISNEVSLNSSGTNQLNISNNGINYTIGGVSGLITNIDKSVIRNFDNPTTDINVYRQSSIPTSEAVSDLIRTYSYISPFQIKITPGNPATYSIELNSRGISGMSYDINYSYDINSDGNVEPSITAGPNFNNVVVDPVLINCLKASKTTVINDFVEYVQDARFSYIDSNTNKRVWLPNKFKRYTVPNSDILYIGDETTHKTFNELFDGSTTHTFDPANISDSSKPEYFLIQNIDKSDDTTPGKYISLNFLYENINLGEIKSSVNGFTYNDSSILSYFNMFSWPFDISFSTDTVFGPNLSSLFRNDYSYQNKVTNPINPNAIRNISGLNFDKDITNFTGTPRNLNFKSISFVENQTFNLNNCTSIASVGNGCKACKLTEFMEAFQMSSWNITTKKPVDLHNFLSNCGANEYFKLNSSTDNFLNLINLTTTEEVLDFSKLNDTGEPFTGYLYDSFQYLMYPGPLTVPTMILSGNYTDSNFYGSLVTEITNLGDIDVENALNLNGTFAFCHNLKSLDIRLWNLDNVLNLNNFIYRSPNLTSLTIKNKYIEFDTDDSIIIKNDHTSFKPVCYTYDITYDTDGSTTIDYSEGGNKLTGYIATNKVDLDRSTEVWTIQLVQHVNEKNSSP